MKDTIVAVATPPGKGGVGIVRVSGDNALKIAKTFFSPFPRNPEHAKMIFGKFKGSVIDGGYCVFFKTPKSYTGEDTVEFHLHGSPYVLKKVVDDILDSGLARLAQPGEFTKRALFNGKINLIEAEAVNSLISAENRYQAKVLSNFSGKLSNFVGELRENLLKSIAYIESAIEYPEEEETSLAVQNSLPFVKESLKRLEKVLYYYEKSRFLFKGARIVLAGKPNVGKSSILNAIAGYERAIVTDIPGTTTDSIEVEIEHKGIKFTFVDTAGLRDAKGKVETLGIKKTLEEIENSDLVLYIFDFEDYPIEIPSEFLRYNSKIIKVLNKIDIKHNPSYKGLKLSAKTGEGIDSLLDRVFDFFENMELSENFIFSERQFRALSEAKEKLNEFLLYTERDFYPEIGVSLLLSAVESLETLIGEITTDDVLDVVFGDFCLGK